MLEIMKKIAENINPHNPVCKNVSVVIHYTSAVPQDVRVSIVNGGTVLSREVATASLEQALDLLATDATLYKEGYHVGLEAGKKLVMSRIAEEIREAA